MPDPARRTMGAYYTPAPIVRYVLERTLGPLLEGRTPDEMDGLRVLDPACGAGAFLLGAYHYLLEWRLRWYLRHALGRWPEALERDARGAWRLSPPERRRVLLGSIFGVDLDPAAVAETARALAACACDGPPPGELLATLARNIRRGNSLVGPDLSGGAAGEGEWPEAFDWAAAFPAAARAGGFDVVVGNPPYLHLKRGRLPPELRRYADRRYATAVGQYDACALFVERALALLAPGGMHAFVLPRPLLAGQSYEPARRALLHHQITTVADGGAPFAGAAVECAVVVVRRAAPGAAPVRLERIAGDGCGTALGEVPQATFERLPFRSLSYRLTGRGAGIVEKLHGRGAPLRELAALLARGIEAGKRSCALRAGPAPGCYPLLRGQDVGRYAVRFGGLFFDPAASGRRAWKDERLYEQPEKLIIRRVAGSVVAALDTGRHWTLNTLYTLVPAAGVDARYLLGCLNARLSTYYLRTVFLADDRLFPYLRISQLGMVPIVAPPAGAARTDQVAALAGRMLELHARLAAARTPRDRRLVQRQIDATDRQIDALVYELFGLTEAELQEVEGVIGDRR
ncbi:MAG TPA: TaqI-like C-terminal specificity domain-containing protein [Roseiflexaceae bacterium]|nr:TaqI-like C-terminal specificity domain-containing protein [Roseiflexaceae bacterium]